MCQPRASVYLWGRDHTMATPGLQELSGSSRPLRDRNRISFLHTRAGSLLLHNTLPPQLATEVQLVTILVQTWPRKLGFTYHMELWLRLRPQGEWNIGLGSFCWRGIIEALSLRSWVLWASPELRIWAAAHQHGAEGKAWTLRSRLHRPGFEFCRHS